MKILLIKLGALGDVLRTTPLLEALKKKYPAGHVTWVVEAQHRPVLEGVPFIDRLLDYSVATAGSLCQERFELALNFDKEPEATGLMAEVPAAKKMGFSQDAQGQLCAADPLSDYAYRLGIDDDLKFRKNQKTYQEISFEQVELVFRKEEYQFSLEEVTRREAREYLAHLGAPPARLKHPVIGLNTGSGARFAGKKLPLESYARLADSLHTRIGATIFLLGGRDEDERNRDIQKKTQSPVFHTGVHPIKRFAAIVELCDLVITGDTTAMHIAIAVKTPVLAYFASTCAQEIELYGRGKTLVSKIACAPCYKKNCPIDEQCMKDMSVEEIVAESKSLLGQHAPRIS